MVSLFGVLPNVIWASILARVFERVETLLGDFDKTTLLRKRGGQRRETNQHTGHGFPAKGAASRILPKGAAGTCPTKPMHDDNNGVISLSCWTSLTVSNAEVDLVFLINGYEVSIRASELRWIFFMGYLPHESRSVFRNNPATEQRLHHSSFVKPEAEYLATHILSTLSCTPGGDDWSMKLVNSSTGMRKDITLVPIAKRKKR
jgi:hypothetical protein